MRKGANKTLQGHPLFFAEFMLYLNLVFAERRQTWLKIIFESNEVQFAMEEFTKNVIEVISQIPEGRVSTYGRISMMAGRPNSARQVARILHSMSRKYDLPWHRVINIKGGISLPEHQGYFEQKARLTQEGIVFDAKDRVDLAKFLWHPDSASPLVFELL